MKEELSFRQFQQFIRQHYHKYDSARGTGDTFLWLMEEVGELASALQHIREAGNQNDPKKLAQLKQNLQEEFADVLGWLSTLANMHDVDLETALHQKYLDKNNPGPHKG